MLGIIGGSGLTDIAGLQLTHQKDVDTPYGKTSASLQFGQLGAQSVVFLPRHGSKHHIPPHKINYRANVWAMQQAQATQLVGVTAVGGITPLMAPGVLCVPDQLIDYTYGREHTYFDGDNTTITHIDFTQPYCQNLRQKIITAANRQQQVIVAQGVYGATQGPRLESAAEIRRMQQDGCNLVGMTGMPEAALAKELDLCYANISLVVNWAAGLANGPISMPEIEQNLDAGMHKIVQILQAIDT